MRLSRGILSLLTVAVLFVVLGAFAGWRVLSEGNSDTATQEEELPSTEGVDVASANVFTQAQAVEGVEVVQDTLWIRVPATGIAEAYRRSRVSTRGEGIVQEVLVRENDFVEAGQVLVQLDTIEAAMTVAEAEAALESATNQFEARMLASGPIEDPEIREERERNLRTQLGIVSAEAELERARINLELTRVTAPFSGRVADLDAVEGQFMSSGGEVLTLVQIDPIKVEVEVQESSLRYMDSGRRASVEFTAISDEPYEARVETVNPIVDPETRFSRVTLVLPNPDGLIRPGMYAEARIDAEAFPNRILIPREAVVERTSAGRRRNVVFMAREVTENGTGMSEWRYVTTGQRNETHVEIIPSPPSADSETQMLEPGEIVLVDGHHYLAHDTPIQIVESVEAVGLRAAP